MAEERLRSDGPEVSADSGPLRRWLIRIGALLLAFLIGFVPMWLNNRQLNRSLEERDRELRRGRIQNVLASAAIYARRGEYETARQNTSSFYTEISQEMDRGENSILTEQERLGMNTVMAERDELITLLSRNDPAAGERLSSVFIEYSNLTHGK
jgi:hypothetical protein